ncbi:MAG: class I SAM-dependent methyltransferase [Hyphomicrobiales bacterium]|uniref:class I SAM-dependent methyltransferase n=1 Tax=Rhabdaerophilum calidifontis TaxID=2604328 RepID=UPI00140AE609|nr:class I SAM-dependent methyltransferase [Rhabdaerophilum calidifontis]MCA1952950.1 class I SAM-dependent methyltransferase [Hyphomicrobiales bacterium]MCA1999514.1 class I SAM-dependent methyltransferase [Hyphomicrobiales bacterium]
MSSKFSYEEYVGDQKFLKEYNAYQEKYAKDIRQSDKKIIDIIIRGIRGSEVVLDIGCSTGNLLKHLRGALPAGITLVGGDLAESSLELARANPDLAGVAFEAMDIMELRAAAYDVIVVNAVLYMMTEAQYDMALASLHRALRPGGRVVIYDFAHPFQQELEIIETSDSHPQGLRLCFRSEKRIAAAFAAAGFASWEFQPFELPIDLPRQPYPNDLITYTRKDEHGARMMFRGTLFQPWCHMIARKA